MKLFNGKTYGDWAKILSISQAALSRRLANGWTEEEACTTPKRKFPERLKKNKFNLSSKHKIFRHLGENDDGAR